MSRPVTPAPPSGAATPRRARRRRWWVVLGVALALVVAAAVAVPAWLGGATRQPPIRLALGEAHTCFLTDEGPVACWGANDHGQLGDATTLTRTGPVAVADLDGVASVAAGGGNHTCALTSGGTVWCWGANDHGQLGDGTTTSSSVPVRVTGLSGATGLAVGRSHACAVRGDGGVSCWGANGVGELGDGSTTDSATPVDVVDLPIAMRAVTAHGSTTCAVTERGRVRCWGDNSDGQLGTGSTAPTLVAVPATGLGPRVTRAAVGDTHACAITLAGSVSCWGANGAGQLGDGTTDARATAVAVARLGSGVASVAAAQDRTCALAGGRVWCWGRGPVGGPDRPTPTEVVDGAREVAVGPGHACAITAEGVSCWGANASGQLGDGASTDSPTPVRVRL